MKVFYSCLFILLIAACGGLNQNEHLNLAMQQPYVTLATPATSGAQLSVDIEFSAAMDQSTVNSTSVFLLTQEQYAGFADWQELVDADSDLTKIVFTTVWSADACQVLLSSTESLALGTDYVLVLLPKILSQAHLPLDQTRAGTTIRSEYTLSLTSESAESEDPTASANSNDDTDAESANDSSTNSEPTVSSEDETPAIEVPEFNWQRVLISEIVVDPQADHGDSSGGNGIPFDATPGTGTIGSTDEYIELYNGSENSVNLTGWSLLMADGTDVTQSLDQASLFSLGGTVTEFQSGEFLVVGNPDGDMKNAISVTLFDDAASLVDSVTLDDANADNLTNEAWMRAENGWDWEAGEASLGF